MVENWHAAQLLKRCHTGTCGLYLRLWLVWRLDKTQIKTNAPTWKKNGQQQVKIYMAILVKNKTPKTGTFSVPYRGTGTVTVVLKHHMISWNWRHMSGGRIPSSYVLWMDLTGAWGSLGGVIYNSLSKCCTNVALKEKRVNRYLGASHLNVPENLFVFLQTAS